MRLASVELRGLTKRFGPLRVVDEVALRIDHGQLVCLLGPSGCGKTTTLRLIAGFLEPSDGEIHVGERVVSSKAKTLPPEDRKMSMIFQSYALWPHMTVAENIVYGLRLRKLDRATIAMKLAAILATTKLEPLAQRYPGELSGGQQHHQGCRTRRKPYRIWRRNSAGRGREARGRAGCGRRDPAARHLSFRARAAEPAERASSPRQAAGLSGRKPRLSGGDLRRHA